MDAVHLSVSVIIPTYNRHNFLMEAIESVQRQNYSAIEIIIVDDGSTDRTAETVKCLQGNIKYIFQQRSGPACARNKGLKIAQGDIIGFLDSDDIWPDNKLDIQLTYFKENPTLGINIGYVQHILMHTGKNSKSNPQRFSVPCFSFNLGSALIRRKVFSQVGIFNESLIYAEDVDWLIRARECGIPIHIMDNVTLYYRIHHDNMIRDKSLRESSFFNVLKASLDRRRNKRSCLADSLPNLI